MALDKYEVTDKKEYYQLELIVHDLPFGDDLAYQANIRAIEEALENAGFRYTMGLGEIQDD